ncbi:MAG: endonuclease III [Kiritimatiellaeota bacterium]|nr:endonuclease III [Kiritimatiellota bacterium]
MSALEATTRDPQRAHEIYTRLRAEHPAARIELDFSNPFELLVATVLSAQCTDARVNRVTARLFRKYRTPDDYLAVPKSELEEDIRSTGFFRRKAESIRRIAQALHERFDDRVPADLEALTSLPGVGRKTANVVLGNAFGIPGIVVDTHVIRVSQRLGLTGESDPARIEQDLMQLFPAKEWVRLSHTLVFHGRYLCKARKPGCERCPVKGFCRFCRD